jgi:hypothetical protein
VYIGYCSSDAWVGAQGFNDNAVGWSFQGQAIIEATVARLVANFSMGATAPPRVLLAGCAAGARGAMATLEYLPEMLPPGTQLRGFFDGPLWVNLAPYSSDIVPLNNQTASAMLLFNATQRLGDACSETYAGTEDWKCLFGQYRLPLIRGTQWFASAGQFDALQLSYDMGAPPPYTGAQTTYADIFQRTVRGIVMTLPAAQQGGSAIYSSACYAHCTSVSGAFWGVRVDGDISVRDYLGEWYWGGPLGNRPQVVEACVGFGCGQCASRTAPATLAPPLPPARLGLYAPPGPVYAPPGFKAKLMTSAKGKAIAAAAPGSAARSSNGWFTGSHLGILAGTMLITAAALRIVAARATRTLGDSAAGSFEMRSAEASPLLGRKGSGGRVTRPGFSAPSLPPGVRVTKVAPVGR